MDRACSAPARYRRRGLTVLLPDAADAIRISLVLHPHDFDELASTGTITVTGLVDPDKLRGIPQRADVTIYAAPTPGP